MKRIVRCKCGFRARVTEAESPWTCVCGRLVSYEGVVVAEPPKELMATHRASGLGVQHAIAVELFPEIDPDSDPTLLGNMAKELFEAIGLPPCGGCEQRRQWINRAHIEARRIWERLRGKPAVPSP